VLFRSEILYLKLIALIIILLISVIVLFSVSKKMEFFKNLKITKSIKLRLSKISKHISRFQKSFLNNFNPRIFTSTFLAHIIKWIVVIVKNYIIFLALAFPIQIHQVFIIVLLSNFIGYMSTVPNGFGVTELVMMHLFVVIGISPELAAAITIIDRAIFYFYNTLLGYFSTIYLQIKN